MRFVFFHVNRSEILKKRTMPFSLFAPYFLHPNIQHDMIPPGFGLRRVSDLILFPFTSTFEFWQILVRIGRDFLWGDYQEKQHQLAIGQQNCSYVEEKNGLRRWWNVALRWGVCTLPIRHGSNVVYFDHSSDSAGPHHVFCCPKPRLEMCFQQYCV